MLQRHNERYAINGSLMVRWPAIMFIVLTKVMKVVFKRNNLRPSRSIRFKGEFGQVPHLLK